MAVIGTGVLVDPTNPTTITGQQPALTATVSGLDAAQQYMRWVKCPGGTGTPVVADPDR